MRINKVRQLEEHWAKDPSPLLDSYFSDGSYKRRGWTHTQYIQVLFLRATFRVFALCTYSGSPVTVCIFVTHIFESLRDIEEVTSFLLLRSNVSHVTQNSSIIVCLSRVISAHFREGRKQA